MKVLATKEFNKKLTDFKDLSLQDKLLKFVDKLSMVKTLNEIKNQFELSIDEIYVHKIDDYRIFFSLDNDTIILADLTKKNADVLKGGFKNPSYNHNINPIYNHNINPIYNHNINPIYNHNINPVYNHNINPIYNHNINPIYNHNINPIYNHNINPIYNHNINPIYNHNINPIYNHNINPIYNHNINPIYNSYFGGPYMYDLNGKVTGYLVKSNDQFINLFNLSNQMKYFGVKFLKGYAIFNLDNNTQSSYFIDNNSKGFNQFNMSGTWIGYVI